MQVAALATFLVQQGESAVDPGMAAGMAAGLSVADDDPVQGLERLKQRLDGIIDGWEEPTDQATASSGATVDECLN